MRQALWFVSTTTRERKWKLPCLFELLDARGDLLVVLALQRGVVGLGALQLGAQAGRRLRLLVEPRVHVVEIHLQVRQRYAQLVALLCTTASQIRHASARH